MIEALSNIITDFFILENVDLEEGGPDSGDATNLDLILRALSDAGDGFHVRAYRLISSDFALPQRRVRLYIVGFSKVRQGQASFANVEANLELFRIQPCPHPDIWLHGAHFKTIYYCYLYFFLTYNMQRH